MASINKVIIIGNLGRDPEVRYTPNGAAVCNLRIATTRNWKHRESGERQEETEWHSVVLYDRQAEVAGEYLKKGRPVYIEGRLKTRKWQDKEGQDRYTTEIVAETMQLLGGRDSMGGGGGGDDEGGGYSAAGGGGGGGNSGGGYNREPSAAPAPRSAPAPRAPAPRPAPKSSTGFDDMDDDIPF